MRFVAGRGAVAERLQRSGAVAEMLAAAWRIAIGKKLLPGRAIGKNILAGGPLKSGRSAKVRKRGSKNIEIAKRLFIAHNALPLLEAAGKAVGNQIKSIEMKSILVKRISLNLSSEINDRGTVTESNNRGTETERSSYKKAAEIGAAMDEAGVEYNWIDVAQWPERNNGYKPEVRFRIAYSQQMLFIEYYVKEANIKALYSEDKESKPFKDSCCEFFFSPECNNNYYNMELNCIGKGTFAFRRGGRKGPKIAYGEEIMKRIFRYSTLGEAPIETSVKENGELFEWKLTVAIPLECFTETPMNELKGKTMRANFYKCGDDMPKPHFLTWNRIELDKPDFHTPDFFGALTFE